MSNKEAYPRDYPGHLRFLAEHEKEIVKKYPGGAWAAVVESCAPDKYRLVAGFTLPKLSKNLDKLTGETNDHGKKLIIRPIFRIFPKKKDDFEYFEMGI